MESIEKISIIPEMPKIIDYASIISVSIGVADIFYRFIYKQEF